MAEPSCQGCRELRQFVAALESRIRELEARLHHNSSNSSVPPSANPLQAAKPVVKAPTGRKPGHEPHLRDGLPAERVQQGASTARCTWP